MEGSKCSEILISKFWAFAAIWRNGCEKFTGRQFLINRVFQKNLKVLLFLALASAGKLSLNLKCVFQHF